MINGKAQANNDLIWHLIFGLEVGWINAVPKPTIEYKRNEWGFARIPYSPSPLEVGRPGIEKLINAPELIAGIEASDIPESEQGQELLINFLQKIEAVQEAARERDPVKKKLSEEVRVNNRTREK